MNVIFARTIEASSAMLDSHLLALAFHKMSLTDVHIVASAVVQQVTLLHHSSRVPSLTLNSDYCLCGVLHVLANLVLVSFGFFWFPPIS